MRNATKIATPKQEQQHGEKQGKGNNLVATDQEVQCSGVLALIATTRLNPKPRNSRHVAWTSGSRC
jgi:hypothetical protein